MIKEALLVPYTIKKKNKKKITLTSIAHFRS